MLYIRRQGDRYSVAFADVLHVFLWGCFTTLPVHVVERITGAELPQETLLKATAVSFLLIAPIEEFSKLAAVWGSIYRNPRFSSPVHGIIYSATAACAFASVENVVHIAQMGPEVILRRIVYATPAHLLFSIIWGYSLGLARFKKTGEVATVSAGFLAAVFFHGSYDFLVALSPRTAMFTLIPLMFFLGFLALRLLVRARKTLPFQPLGNCALTLCANCGAYASENETHCPRCGFGLPNHEPDDPLFCPKCRAPVRRFKNCDNCGEVLQRPSCGEGIGSEDRGDRKFFRQSIRDLDTSLAD